jgi:type IV pilus assembly protein PilO
MLRSSKLPANWREPRVLLRGIIGALLLVNVIAAVIAFKPFGGGADDLQRDEANLQQQLTALRKRIADSKQLVEKMQTSRHDKDQFLAKYVTDAGVGASTMAEELDRIATASGVRPMPSSLNRQDVEGSETFKMYTITSSYEGNYAALAKFINLVDKSPKFLIIESLETEAPQQNGAALNVRLKIDTFVNGSEGTL